MLDQVAAFFAIICLFVLLPAVVLGWSVAKKWLDLQQEMLILEREKVRLLAARGEVEMGAESLAQRPMAQSSEGRDPAE